MPFILANKQIGEIFYGGKSISRAYLNGRCLFVKADHNIYLMYDKNTEGILSAGGGYALAASHTPFSISLKDWSTKEWTLSFRYNLTFLKGPTRLLRIPGVFTLSSFPAADRIMEFNQEGAYRVLWLPKSEFCEGENLVEISRKNNFMCIFINGRSFVLPPINLSLAEQRIEVFAPRTLLKNIVLKPGAAVHSWPEIPSFINTCSNLVPTNITEENLQGFVISKTNTESGPINSFNPSINLSYPRWQAYGIGASFTLSLPEGKSGAVLKYTVTQWTDTGSSRVVTGWTLEGSFDGKSWETIDVIKSDPWEGQTSNGMMRIFVPNNHTNYRCLRMTITAARGNSYCSLGQIRFYTEDPYGDEIVD